MTFAKFQIVCKGRDPEGNEVLEEAVDAGIEMRDLGDTIISSNVLCPYNTGGHGQRCKASHPDADKVGEGVNCPYSFDIPYALESRTPKGAYKPSE